MLNLTRVVKKKITEKKLEELMFLVEEQTKVNYM